LFFLVGLKNELNLLIAKQFSRLFYQESLGNLSRLASLEELVKEEVAAVSFRLAGQKSLAGFDCILRHVELVQCILQPDARFISAVSGFDDFKAAEIEPYIAYCDEDKFGVLGIAITTFFSKRL
jgi:hypothetical protein